MPNVNAPNGLRPYLHSGGGTQARLGQYTIAYNYTTAIFSGDLVKSAGNARDIILVPDGTTAPARGVFAGCQYVDNSGQLLFSPFWPGTALSDSTKIVTCWVYDDPNMEFVAQKDTVALADIGLAYQWDNGTGSTVTGRSGGSITSTTTTPQVRLEGLGPNPDGQIADVGAFARVRVKIFAHELLPGFGASAGLTTY